jgi:signal peptidase I
LTEEEPAGPVRAEPVEATEGVADAEPPAADSGEATGDADPAVPSKRSSKLDYPLLVVAAIVLALVTKTFVAQAFVIPSPSMYPELKEGDRVVVSKLAYDLHDPRRGDIVVFPSPGAPATDHAALPIRLLHDVLEAAGLRRPSEEELIKRVVGLPGETVAGRGGHVYVDDHLLVEPYLGPDVFTDDFGPVTVPAGEVWVMGDNRTNSADSRVIGPIAERTIVGRALFRVWPPWRVAFL